MNAEPTIRLVLNDGTDTGPVPMSAMKEAVDIVTGKKGRAGGRLPMKETQEDQAVTDRAYGIAADELRQFIEQFEQLEAEKKDIAERQKEVMAEAKARGYSTKIMKQVIALRRRDKDDVAEEEAILDMYLAALGMA